MATYYSQGTGNWSSTTNWDTVAGGGGSDPASGNEAGMDNHTYIIQVNHTITLDLNMTAWAVGIAGLTITGHATTPGMLRAKYDTDASYGLKIKTGTTIQGTDAAAKGRLLANSDGVWGNTGALPFARKFIISLDGTANITADYLDIALYGIEPGIKSIATYLAKQTVVGSAANDTLTKNSHGYADTTPIMFQVSGGTLPAPLTTTDVYYVRDQTANTFKVALVSGEVAINLTSDGSGTIESYTGHAATNTPTMNVLTDVTGDPQWVSGASVVLVNTNQPWTCAQQRVTINGAPNAGNITISENVGSAQYPGARIFLMTRNVAIRSNTTASINIVSYPSGATHGGVFQCEIRSTAGTGTTFYGTGVVYGTGHTISGTVSGNTYGVLNGTGHTISGTVSGNSSGVYSGTGHTISGTVSGNSSGVYSGTGHAISGTVSGNTYGVETGTGHTISGTVSGNTYGVLNGPGFTISGTVSGNNIGVFNGTGFTISGTVSGNSYGVLYGTAHTISGTVSGNTYDFRYPVGAICRSAAMADPPTFSDRNTAGIGSRAGSLGIYCEDYGGVLGASRAFHPTGDVIKNAAIVRSGGAASSLQVVPLSECKTAGVRGAWTSAQIRVLAWTEMDVPASAQTKTIYIRGSNATAWSTYPTAAELFVEAVYLNHGTLLTHATAVSTAVLTDNTTWTAFPVTFTPAQAGPVRYRVIFGAYTAGAEIFVDNQLATG